MDTKTLTADEIRTAVKEYEGGGESGKRAFLKKLEIPWDKEDETVTQSYVVTVNFKSPLNPYASHIEAAIIEGVDKLSWLSGRIDVVNVEETILAD